MTVRMLRRDTAMLALYKAGYQRFDDGDGGNVYNEPPAARFAGSIQPYNGQNSPEARGIVLRYTHVVYTPRDMGFKETDRIFDGRRWFEIKTIERWHGHVRVMAEEVEPNERHRQDNVQP